MIIRTNCKICHMEIRSSSVPLDYCSNGCEELATLRQELEDAKNEVRRLTDYIKQLYPGSEELYNSL